MNYAATVRSLHEAIPDQPSPASPGELFETARALASDFAATAAERDRTLRRAPAQAAAVARSGLLALRIPIAEGGTPHLPSTVIEVARIIATGDPSLAQIIQNHYVPIEVLTHWGYPDSTREHLFDEVRHGAQFSTASAPKTAGESKVPDARTTLLDDGSRRIRGGKYFVTGGYNADWLFVTSKAEDGGAHRLLVPTADPGVEILDDWEAIGQRGTGSGTVIFHDVVVPPDYFVETPPAGASWYMPFTQAIHSALLVGLARAAFDDAVRFIQGRGPGARGSKRAADAFVAGGIGVLSAKVKAAETLLAYAAEVIDEVDHLGGHKASRADYDRAHVAAQQARIFGGEVALAVSQELFELGGAHAALSETGLDRHWRNARTHTLQRSLTWVSAGVGSVLLEGDKPTFSL